MSQRTVLNYNGNNGFVQWDWELEPATCLCANVCVSVIIDIHGRDAHNEDLGWV